MKGTAPAALFGYNLCLNGLSEDAGPYKHTKGMPLFFCVEIKKNHLTDPDLSAIIS